MSRESSSHLKKLENESIAIIREVIAECRRPVMLYSIGKDLSVLLHLAQKAFYPAKLPFPLLHIDTGWKFREMIAFRDDVAGRLGLDLIVHTNAEGQRQNINPFDHGAAYYTHMMKTEALNRRSASMVSMRRSAARGATRRDRARRSASSRSGPRPANGIRGISGRSSGDCTMAASTRAKSIRVFPLSNWTELDIWHYIERENRSRSSRYISPPSSPSSSATAA